MINTTINLKNITNTQDVYGISSLNPHGKCQSSPITLDTIKLSRGEFVGYVSDSTTRCIRLFRDRVGGRSLYYSIINNGLAISTSFTLILQKITNPTLNYKYIMNEYLPFQIPFSNQTMVREIFRVMPAEIVTIKLSGEIKRDKYWSIVGVFGQERFDPNELYRRIDDAVEFRKSVLPESAAITGYLSGGIDSSSVVCIANPTKVFSGYYKNEYYSELDYINAVLKHKPYIRGNMLEIVESDFKKFIRYTLPRVMPDPMCGLGVISQSIIATHINLRFRQYSHAWTGEGGDEVFSGYPWNDTIVDVARCLRNKIRRDKYSTRWEPMISGFFKGLVPMVASSVSRIDNTDGLESRIGLIMEHWDEHARIENNIMRFNIEVGLPAIMTVDSMVGEISNIYPLSPLADHHIIEYVASIDPEQRMTIPKGLLRDAMKEVLPEKVRMRSDKMGFPIPVNDWNWEYIKKSLIDLNNKEIIPHFKIPSILKMDRRWWGLLNVSMIARLIKGEEGIIHEP